MPSTPTKGLLASFLLLGVMAAPASAAADEEVVDGAIELIADGRDLDADGDRVAGLLRDMGPFDAVRTAATTALSSNVHVRRALARALVTPFQLVGDDFLLDHLSRDDDPLVRETAARAARVRNPRGSGSTG
jgi:hypothetical protein